MSVDFDVPGNPAAVRARAATARSKGQSFTEVATALDKVHTDGWTGRAADHFRDAFE
ncbi:MAG: putative T7SS-secreted protein, partial [Actinomycetes bacterium]